MNILFILQILLNRSLTQVTLINHRQFCTSKLYQLVLTLSLTLFTSKPSHLYRLLYPLKYFLVNIEFCLWSFLPSYTIYYNFIKVKDNSVPRTRHDLGGGFSFPERGKYTVSVSLKKRVNKEGCPQLWNLPADTYPW